MKQLKLYSKNASEININVLPDGRMDRDSAAAYLGMKPHTLVKWAIQEKGPRFVRVGGRVFYFLADLDAFIQRGATNERA